MAVMAREAWTDDRLDALNRKVDEGFKEIRAEMREEFQGIRGEMAQVRGELVQVRAEIGAFNRTVIQFAWAVVGTMFVGSMGTIAALITIV